MTDSTLDEHQWENVERDDTFECSACGLRIVAEKPEEGVWVPARGCPGYLPERVN